ncbi:homoserine O-acetyltransferase [Brachybacterium endophyticum]|uniref:Homoserine O-acetyltransferase n=1 Tax=Brachybacterium endophyticum TaxID=2182385 RepID=A0A2U2RJ15_9MICO|nr:homoserine O-acetyltransferase [Brachybacterium endophyticum]PWH05853.1 homoserine O-acetyltransferase [Brachybacterium endophyticum]
MTAPTVPPLARPLVPASGAWGPEQGPGRRRFVDIGSLDLESGRTLPSVTMAYETWGTPTEDGSNAVLVLHALTGDSHVIGDAGPSHPTAGWWGDLVGPGRPVDTDRYFVVAPNVLGGCQGSTGPSSPGPDGRPWGSRFPQLTVRDQVAAERALAEQLGIQRWALVIGGSMGGMRALEWGVSAPEATERLAVIASSARASADQIAFNDAQIAAIRADVGFLGGDYYESHDGEGPHRGLGVARRIAHITYRTAAELEERFSNRSQGEEDVLEGGRHQVTSYLDHHADKLSRRFDANSYVCLAGSMSTHDVGRGRGGVATALERIRARTLLVSISSDRLFPPALVAEAAAAVPGVDHRVVESPHGHDGFLLPHPALREWLGDLLGR